MITNADDRWTRAVARDVLIKATSRPDSALLERFMAGYDRAFVLPNEREEIDGFRACLAINPVSRHRFGRTHCELVMVLEDETGALLGGANFLATRIDKAPAGHPLVAVALNYLFVDVEARGRGLSRTLKQAVEELANEAVDAPAIAAAPALFIEQNDPLKLSEEEYAADSAHSGIDQVDRLAVWARLGAKLVDFPYIQPALSANQGSDHSLAYAVMNFPGHAMDPSWFAAHLESFFAISVLKGGELSRDPAVSGQLAGLGEMALQGQSVSLLPMQQAVEALRAKSARPGVSSLRELARGLVHAA